MQKITEHNRAESNAQVDRAKRYAQIISILRNGDMTAKEVAVEMFNRGYVSSSERNKSFLISPNCKNLIREIKR